MKQTNNIKPSDEGGEEFVSIDEAIEQVEKYKPTKKAKDTGKPKARVGATPQITREGDGYVATNLTLYGLDGELVRYYSRIEMDAHSYNTNAKVDAEDTPQNWVNFYKKEGKSMLSLPLWYAIVEAAFHTKEEAASQNLLESFKPDFEDCPWLVTSTRFCSSIFHDVETAQEIEVPIKIPRYRVWLENVAKKSNWKQPLRALFMAKDVKEITKVLSYYGRTQWDGSRDSKGVEWPVFVGYDLNIGFGPIDGHGRSRGVLYLEKPIDLKK